MNYYMNQASLFMLHRFTKQLIYVLTGISLLFHFQVYVAEAGSPQEAKINQRKLNKDRAKKEKEGHKLYEKAVKRHMDNQSKETKIMMKQARKDSKKNTPLK